MKVILLLVVSVLVRTHSTSKVYYVKSENSTEQCHDLNYSCETLQYYALNDSLYFTSDTKFVFLPGIHSLNTSISILNKTNLSFSVSLKAKATIICENPAGLIFQNSSMIELTNITFNKCGQIVPPSIQRDGETAQAALIFEAVTDLTLDSILVNDSQGYGLLAYCVPGNFIVISCSFQWNKGSKEYLGGNAAIEYTNCSKAAAKTSANLNISSSDFSHGSFTDYGNTNYTKTLATGLLLVISSSNINVNMVKVSMKNNNNSESEGLGANLFIHFFNRTGYTASRVNIVDSEFTFGRSWLGSGIAATFFTSSTNSCTTEQCTNVLNISNTEISSNQGSVGCGLYIEFQLNAPHSGCPYAKVDVLNSRFSKNSLKIIPNKDPLHYVGNGVAVHLLSKYENNRKIQHVTRHFKVNFKNNTYTETYHVYQNNHTHENGTPNYFINVITAGVTFTISNAEDGVFLHNCSFVGNNFTGLSLHNSQLTLSGEILIKDNTGVNGGGMILCESSKVLLAQNTSLTFINNSAIYSGGGIYAEEECINSKPFCFYQTELSDCKNITASNVHIEMINNTAGFAGDHVFGGRLDQCIINKCTDQSTTIFNSLFTLIPSSSLSPVSSYPKSVCFCTENKPNCSIQTYTYEREVFPGETISVDVVIVGQLNGTVPGTISSHCSNQPPILHTTEKYCKTLNIVTKTMDLSSDIIMEFHVASNLNTLVKNVAYLSFTKTSDLKVKVKECPPGFILSNGICSCAHILSVKGLSCNISTQSIIRQPPAWIGYNNLIEKVLVKEIIYHDICPYDYCRDEEVTITSDGKTFDQDKQCAQHRTGLLCGKCEEGYSVGIYTSDCITCKNIYSIPVVTVGYLISGIILVIFLVASDITYTDGTFSGLIFYANIISMNDFIFFQNDKHGYDSFLAKF